MEQEAKLISCESLQGEKLQFIILNNQELGSGAFGVVKKAYEQSRQFQQLAVKIVPFRDESTKQKINKQVEIMKQLDVHPNLVRVQPLKCFSQKNFYIFMEYCNQGTLQSLMKSKIKNRQNFTEEEIFQIFHQILSGYEVLWKKQILHQDLKPDNILIKNGVFKITDFGFSIFYQGVVFQKTRQGTFPYMPLQKLTVQNYRASTKSDVFSLGVIFFKMITGRHPYVLTQFQSHKQYIAQLRLSELSVPSHIRARMSLPMQHLFEIILKMIAKKQNDRIDFAEIYKFMAQQQTFLRFTGNNNLTQSIHSEQIKLPKQTPLRFVQYSKAFMIPFSIPFQEQNDYEKQLLNQQLISEEKRQIEVCLKIQKYLCSMRLMVYFFDRLSRKLIVQKMRKTIKNELNQETQIEEKAILCLLYLATKITTQTIQQSKYMRVFAPEQWRIYKKTDPYILKLIRKDEQYLKCIKNEAIMETKQSKIKDRNQIIEKSKLQLSKFMQQEVRTHMIQLLQSKTGWISVDDRKTLTTLNYIISAIDIIDNFKERHQEWQKLEGFFRKMEIQQIQRLLYKVTKGLDHLNIEYSIDEGQWDNDQNQSLSEKAAILPY